MLPKGEVVVTPPSGVVGASCPPVMPYTSLLNRRHVTSMFLRAAWMRWLPPMARPSPSPVMTMTVSSGRASLRPVAKAGARPWVAWRVQKSIIPGSRLLQPMPATTATRSWGRPTRSMARRSAPATIPWLQPGHRTWGILGSRRNRRTSPIGRGPPRGLAGRHGFEDLLRRDGVPVRAAAGDDRGRSRDGALHLAHDLAEVHLGHHHGPHRPGRLRHLAVWEGPQDRRAQEAHPQAPGPGLLDRLLGRAGDDPVGDDRHLGILQAPRVHGGDDLAEEGDLGETPPLVGGDGGGVLGGESPLIVREPRHVEAVPAPEVGERGHAVGIGRVGAIGRRRDGRAPASRDAPGRWLREDDLLAHVG